MKNICCYGSMGIVSDFDSRRMVVLVCPSENEADCERCTCAIASCTNYEFGEWMYFNCDDLPGNYIRLTNEDGRMFVVSTEVEAFGYYVL